MARISVVSAYKTDHYPLDGNLAEEVLTLADGRAIYLNPGVPDEVYPSQAEAFEACIGTPEAAPALLVAWQDGYEVADEA